MSEFYEPTEEERLVALELLENAFIMLRGNRYGTRDEIVGRQYRIANGFHNVPTFLMGFMSPEQAREHLEFLNAEFPAEMESARHSLSQNLAWQRRRSH